MNLKNIILTMALTIAASATAQQKQGGISQQMLQEIEKQQTSSASDRALFNALASNSIDNLARNYRRMGPVDTYFSVETPKQNIHDQKSSA